MTGEIGGRMLRLGPKLDEVRSLGFSPDGRSLLAFGLNRQVGGLLRFERLAVVWDVTAPQTATAVGFGPGFDPTAAFFLPDGRVLGIDSRGNWRAVAVEGGPVQVGRSVLRGRLEPVAVAPDGWRVVLFGRGLVRCIPLVPGAAGWEDRHPGYEQPTAAAFSPDGRRVAVAWATPRAGVGGGTVHDVESGAVLDERLEWGERFRLAWSPDGERIAAVGRHAVTVFAADLRHGDEWRDEEDLPLELTAAVFHPGGSLVLADEAGQITVSDAVGLEPVRVYDFGTGPVTALALSPDGGLGAAAGRNGLVVWDVDG